MKVALISRSTLFTVPGGDTVQVEETAGQLNLKGVQADIILSGGKPDLSSYDLLHFFNITRPADIIRIVNHSPKPFVVTPIWIDYSVFDKFHRNGLAGKAFRLLSPAAVEYTKTIARWAKGNDNSPGITYLVKGHDRIIGEILERASFLLTNSMEEYEELKNRYQHLAPGIPVTLGINEELFRPVEPLPREANLVLCAGRIEGLKNQLNLIRALNDSQYQLVLAGSPAPNQQDYYEACRKAASHNIHFTGQLSQAELVNYYRRAKVHALPSWYESCGLASLEAAALGCNLVITRNGFATSYFGDDAFYCDPSSPASIAKAINAAAVSGERLALQQRILNQHTWARAADQTINVYQKVLSAS